jgi:HPr kinase/phosphorylase
VSDGAALPGPVSEQILHASCVAFGGPGVGSGDWRGLLILGAAGSGKSALALGLMALGARLVADDRTHLTRRGGAVMARAPEAIAGLIEARGLGILGAEALDEVALEVVIDLDGPAPERLPPRRTLSLLDCDFPLLHGPASPCLPAALLQYFKGGRQA